MISSLKHSETSSSFREGMTLNEYLSSANYDIKHSLDLEEVKEEDLYQTSQRKVQHHGSRKIFIHEIRESQQDDYDQSMQTGFQYYKSKVTEAATSFPINGITPIQETMLNEEDQDLRNRKLNSRDFRVRRQSNSPYRQQIKEVVIFSPGKLFSKTLNTNNNWRIHKQPQNKVEPPSSSSTIYGKFIKPIKMNEKEVKNYSDKQKYFKKKNTQEIDHISKYERELHEKYDKSQLVDLINMRIEGVQDRLCERKNKKIK